MVLEKLGNTLKDTLAKIASSIFVDEKLINELVKDIQRALLQSDVNVKLVFELTNSIKDRIKKEETPSALTKKEHLINIVYEELTNFLGREAHEIKIGKKPFKIMLVGLFGNGKCVHKDSNILLWDGQTTSAENLYNTYTERGEFKIEDGYIIPPGDDIYVPSLNTQTLKTEKKRVSHLWKLNSKDLIEVNLDNGNNFSVKTTYEHPFFILAKGNVEQKRADELKTGDIVAVPNNFTAESRVWEFQKKIKQLNLDVYVEENKIKEIKKNIITKYRLLQNAVKKLPYKRNYAKFTHSLKRGQIPIQFYNCSSDEKLKLKHYSAQDAILFPTKLTSELAEFIGYIIGDGFLSRNSIHITNADQEIISRVKYLAVRLFSKNISETKDKRGNKALHLRLNSSTAVKLISELFNIPIGKKGRKLEVPRLIQESSLEIISGFLQAYFDCDAYFAPNTRNIELSSESQTLLRQVQHMLLRFNILGVQSKKIIKGKEYYKLNVQARHALRFSEKVNSRIKRKQKALESYEPMTIIQGDGKQDMIPVGTLLKELRESLGYTINQIQKEVSSYGRYEEKGNISRSSLRKVIQVYKKKEKGNFTRLIDFLENKEVNKLKESFGINQPLINALVGEFKNKGMLAEVTNSPTKLVLTDKGDKYIKNLNKGRSFKILETLKTLAYSDLSWIKVKKLSRIKNDSEFVYDLTVEDNHNFIADGIIVHNTTTSGKLTKYYMKRGYKVALVGLDIHRPAAMDQLEQAAAQVGASVFIDRKKKDVISIWKEYEKEINKFDIVLIDTAGRDALSEDLIEELSNINKEIKPDENILIMSADIGQAAQSQAQKFHETCGVTGVIITRLDGTAKGGGALSACAVTGAPVKFIGVGEKPEDLDRFDPKRFVGRLLGMGDIEALLEKAKEAISEEKAEDLGKKFLKGKFNLIDLYEQMQAMSKMGPLGKVMEMIPGMGQLKLPKDMIKVQESKLKQWRFVMDSCTKEELEDPEQVMSPTRIQRIANGAGVTPSTVRELIKQYRQSKKMIKMLGGGSQKGLERAMKKFQSGGMQQVKFK